jgi:hypothetical protein
MSATFKVQNFLPLRKKQLTLLAKAEVYKATGYEHFGALAVSCWADTQTIAATSVVIASSSHLRPAGTRPVWVCEK